MIAVYCVTLLLSAFLVFSIQPMFAKMVLPSLGGAANVWNTSMVFFQVCLLIGYAYAHISSRYLKPTIQIAVHLCLLSVGLLLFPAALNEPAFIDINQHPIFWQLSLMTFSIGLPFTVVSGTAPLVQRWFSNTEHRRAHDPYFLYVASNIGSLLGLISYPIVVERMLSLVSQKNLWISGFIGLIGTLLALLFSQKGVNPVPTTREPIGWTVKLRWVGLAFLPSSLMLSVTTFITTDITPVPLFWIVPFSLYLITFIIAFSEKHKFDTGDTKNVLIWLLAILLLQLLISYSSFGKFSQFLTHLGLFFVVSLLMHGRLYSLRPSVANLTGFYFYISLGGVLGGVFNVLIAPLMFLNVEEYSIIAIIMAFALRRVPMMIAFASIVLFPNYIVSVKGCTGLGEHKTVYRERSFYGAMHVNIEGSGAEMSHRFYHGTTLHGIQLLSQPDLATSYYHQSGPLGDVFALYPNQRQRVAAIGLGTGTIATYATDQRSIDFFEIDPLVVAIARNTNLFTYLSRARGEVNIFVGDGRVKLAERESNQYQVVVLDAFSSDNIPAHLLTREAIELLLSKATATGIVVFHISNRWMDLEPVIARAGRHFDKAVLIKRDTATTDPHKAPSIYMAMVNDVETQNKLLATEWKLAVFPTDFRLWTDDYSNIIRILK